MTFRCTKLPDAACLLGQLALPNKRFSFSHYRPQPRERFRKAQKQQLDTMSPTLLPKNWKIFRVSKVAKIKSTQLRRYHFSVQ